MSNNEYAIAILAGFAVVIPYIIPWLGRKDKLSKSSQLIEMIKIRGQILGLIDRKDIHPILNDKLKDRLDELNHELRVERGHSKRIFIVIISLNIFFIFSILSEIISKKSTETGMHFLEGVFELPLFRIILLWLLMIVSYGLMNRFTKLIYKTISNEPLLYIIKFFLFNLIFVILILFTYVFLRYSDPIISWY